VKNQIIRDDIMHRLIIFVLSICFVIIAIQFTYSQVNEQKVNNDSIEGREKEVSEVDKILNLTYKDLVNNNVMSLYDINKGIIKIKKGNSSFLRKISYIKYRLFLRGINIYAKSLRVHPIEILSIDRLSSSKKKKNITNALIGGIKNRDPRVRLSVAYFFKELELSYNVEKKLFEIFKKETVETGYYVFVDPELNIHEANPQFELVLIQKFLERKRLVSLIKRNIIAADDMANIKRHFFNLLTERIANEPSNQVPISFFGVNKIDYFIAGLSNKDSYIKQKCAEHIYLLFPNLDSEKQKEVEKLIDKFYMLKLVFRQKDKENKGNR
jgi:hypothetical protein